MYNRAARCIAQYVGKLTALVADDLRTFGAVIFGQPMGNFAPRWIDNIDQITALEIAVQGGDPRCEQTLAVFQRIGSALIDCQRACRTQPPAEPAFASGGSRTRLEQRADTLSCDIAQAGGHADPTG